MAGEFGYAARTAFHLPLTFILENTMKTQEPSVGARVEGDPASLGVGLIMGEAEADGHGGFRVPVKWMGTQRQMIWKMYVEDLTIVSPAGDNKYDFRTDL
jgi:hypothetical protein